MYSRVPDDLEPMNTVATVYNFIVCACLAIKSFNDGEYEWSAGFTMLALLVLSMRFGTNENQLNSPSPISLSSEDMMLKKIQSHLRGSLALYTQTIKDLRNANFDMTLIPYELLCRLESETNKDIELAKGNDTKFLDGNIASIMSAIKTAGEPTEVQLGEHVTFYQRIFGSSIKHKMNLYVPANELLAYKTELERAWKSKKQNINFFQQPIKFDAITSKDCHGIAIANINKKPTMKFGHPSA